MLTKKQEGTWFNNDPWANSWTDPQDQGQTNAEGDVEEYGYLNAVKGKAKGKGRTVK